MYAEAATLEAAPCHVEHAEIRPKRVQIRGPRLTKRPKIREGALRGPWEDPDFDANAPLPAERTWLERRAAVIIDLRADLAIARQCIAEECCFPGKAGVQGPALVGFIERIEVALALWEPELAAGEPPEDAPSSEEIPPGYWHAGRR